MTIAETITLLSYVLLGIGAYWLLVHAVPVVGALRLRRGKRWTEQASQIGDRLENHVAQMRTVRSALAEPATHDGLNPIVTMRSRINNVLSAGPSRGIQRWLDDTHACDAPLRSAISESIQSETTTPTGYLRIASTILQPDWLRVHKRFNLLTSLAPIVGLLGTVSGSQVFIAAYSATDAGGRSIPPLSGIGDALMTTAIGIILTVAAYLIAMAAAHIKRRYEQRLAEATEAVLNAYRRWSQERHRLENNWNLRLRSARHGHRP